MTFHSQSRRKTNSMLFRSQHRRKKFNAISKPTPKKKNSMLFRSQRRRINGIPHRLKSIWAGSNFSIFFFFFRQMPFAARRTLSIRSDTIRHHLCRHSRGHSFDFFSIPFAFSRKTPYLCRRNRTRTSVCGRKWFCLTTTKTTLVACDCKHNKAFIDVVCDQSKPSQSLYIVVTTTVNVLVGMLIPYPVGVRICPRMRCLYDNMHWRYWQRCNV